MRFILFIILSLFLEAHMLADAKSSKRWSGYLEGGYNFIGDEVFLDRDSGEEKKVEGNLYWAEAGIKYDRVEKDSETHLDAKFQYTDLAYLQYSVKEASIKHKYKSVDLSYGRVYVNWSPLDRSWQLGHVNGRVNFDYYDSEQEGLVGLLLQSKNRTGFTWELFGSPIYVPELNPGQDIDEDNGTIKPKSAWASEIANEVDLGSGSIPIFYDVDTPEITDIVFQYSLGARLGYRTQNFSANAFYMRKPENNLTLGAGVRLDPVMNNQLTAGIEPRVFYHDVIGGDINYKLKNGILLRASTLFSLPEREPEDAFSRQFSETTNIKTGKRRENYWGVSAIKQGRDYRLALRYIARVSEFDRTDDVLAQNPRWGQAVNVFAQFRFAKKFRATLDAKYDMLSFDTVISADLTYQASRNLQFRAGVRVIGIDENEISFWTPYVNHDSVYGAVRLVF